MILALAMNMAMVCHPQYIITEYSCRVHYGYESRYRIVYEGNPLIPYEDVCADSIEQAIYFYRMSKRPFEIKTICKMYEILE